MRLKGQSGAGTSSCSSKKSSSPRFSLQFLPHEEAVGFRQYQWNSIAASIVNAQDMKIVLSLIVFPQHEAK